MKKITFNLGFYLLLLAASLATFSGCNEDEDTEITDFIGTYEVSEVCDSVTVSYVLAITPVTGSDDAITITNLWDWEEQMSATISGNKISIPSQIADDVIFSGSGQLSGNILTITYTTIDGVDVENCVATATKQ